MRQWKIGCVYALKTHSIYGEGLGRVIQMVLRNQIKCCTFVRFLICWLIVR